VIGLVTGLVAAALMIGLLRRYLIPDHLQNGVALMFVVVAFALSNLLHHESGLLTVTVMGLVVANQRLITIRHIVEFKENLQVLLVGTLFILLAARMKPGSILALGWESVLFVAVLILIARPLSVLISTAGSSFSWKERLFVMWMAPRGIVAASVASVFSFGLIDAGVEGAEELASITFLVIVGTVTFYGLTAGPVARRLGLAERNPQGVVIAGAHPLARAIARVLCDQGITARLLDTNWDNVRAGRREGLE